MKTSENGYRLIKEFEGLKLKAYKCLAGVLTIGYGHTKGVKQNQEITIEQAQDLLKKDVEKIEKDLAHFIRVPLNQNQYDALVSFTFNVGIYNLKQSTLLQKLNNGKYEAVPEQIRRWVFVKKRKVRGLIERREKEAQLFLKKD